MELVHGAVRRPLSYAETRKQKAPVNPGLFCLEINRLQTFEATVRCRCQLDQDRSCDILGCREKGKWVAEQDGRVSSKISGSH